MNGAHRALADFLTLKSLADSSPAWSLLRAKNAPVILSICAAVFQSDNRQVDGSELILTVDGLLHTIRDTVGADFLPHTATQYVTDWVKAGYLIRRSPYGTREEQYELSTDAHLALEYLRQLVSPERTVTKSRLGTLFHNLQLLETETNPDAAVAISRLEAQKRHIEERIAQIKERGVGTIDEADAVERAREILSLARDLPTDFSRVRADIEDVDKELRASIVGEQINVGDILDNVFRGVDLIGDSDAGRAFAGFYEVFLDQEKSAQFDAIVESVMSRDFVEDLAPEERRALMGMMDTLYHSSGQVHDSMTALSRSLRRFVQSREAEAQQALAKTIQLAQQLAVQVGKNITDARMSMGVELELTTRQPTSLSTWKLYDPADYAIEHEELIAQEVSAISFEAMRARIRSTEIDWKELHQAISDSVAQRGAASISDVLSDHPATQGLASVVGLIRLASTQAQRGEGTEQLRWQSAQGQHLMARYPMYYFTATAEESRAQVQNSNHALSGLRRG